MSRPDDHFGAPPGGSGPPAGTGAGMSGTGWAPEPGRPVAGPGWSPGMSGTGGAYPPLPAGGFAGPVGGGSYRPVGGGSYQPVGGSGSYSPAGGAAASPSGAAPETTGGGPQSAPPDGSRGHRRPQDPAKLFGIVIAALGVLNFVFGFLPQVTANRIGEGLSVYAVGPGYVPVLLLIAGLLALAVFLPGDERSPLAVAAVSIGGAVGALISLGSSGPLELLAAGQVSKGLGAVLLTIFGIIQAVVAVAGYVVGADLRVGTGSRSTAERSGGGADSPAPHGWLAADPAPAWSTPPAPVAPAPAVAPEAAGSVGYYSGYAPVPGTGTGAGGPAAPGAMSTWGPPADDDRPTGPQPVIDQEDLPGRSPAERELPRVAPGWPDRPGDAVEPGSGEPGGSGQPPGSGRPVGSAQPAGLVEPSDRSPDTRSRHAAVEDRTGSAPTPSPDRNPSWGRPDEAATEVYRIPPRTGPDGPPGS